MIKEIKLWFIFQINAVDTYAASVIGYLLYSLGQVFMLCIFGNRLIEEVHIIIRININRLCIPAQNDANFNRVPISRVSNVLLRGIIKNLRGIVRITCYEFGIYNSRIFETHTYIKINKKYQIILMIRMLRVRSYFCVGYTFRNNSNCEQIKHCSYSYIVYLLYFPLFYFPSDFHSIPWL